MKLKATAVLAFITLVVTALVTVVQTLPPPPLSADAPAARFSAGRAIRHIQVIAAQPRLTGTAAYEAAADYVLAELEDMGLETETQRIEGLRNTLGWIKGDSSSGIVLLTAHLDSTPTSPGATDDGSGVAVLLETARALMSTGAPRNTVMFLFTDGEEFGSKGARAFIYKHPQAQNVKIVVGFDAGGIGGPNVLSASSANNGWLIRQLARSGAKISGSSAVNTLATTNADFTSAFARAGYSGYAFSLYWDRRIHTPEDAIENLNPASIQQQGDHALALARHYGNLDRLDDPRKFEAVYFSVLRLFIVRYSPAWAMVMAVALDIAFVSVLVYGLRRKAFSWVGIAYGLGVFLAGLMMAVLPDFVLASWISRGAAHSSDRALVPSLQAGLYVLTALLLVLLCYALSRIIKGVGILDRTIGALVPMAIAMAGTSFIFPAISYIFTWPLLFSLSIIAYWLYLSAHQKNLKPVLPGLLFSGAISIIVIVPVIVLGAFEFEHIRLTLAILGVLCGFLAPQIHLIVGSGRDKESVFSRAEVPARKNASL